MLNIKTAILTKQIFKMSFMGFKRTKSTFGAIFQRYSTRQYVMYFVQFTTKDMWFKPHKEYSNNDKTVIYGWLTFYFGKSILGVDTM